MTPEQMSVVKKICSKLNPSEVHHSSDTSASYIFHQVVLQSIDKNKIVADSTIDKIHKCDIILFPLGNNQKYKNMFLWKNIDRAKTCGKKAVIISPDGTLKA
jgi:hypothetical protein